MNMDLSHKKMAACTKEEQWYYYVSVGLITFFGGLILLLPCRVIWYLCCKEHDDDLQPDEYHTRKRTAMRSCFSRSRAAAVAIISGHSPASKFMVVIVFLLNMTAIGVYLIEVSEYTVDDCGTVRDNNIQLVYMSLCALFAIHYGIRFVAATDKTYFWLDVYSIVDHMTIGPTFMSLYTDRNWLGLKFLRLLYLLQLPEILQLVHIIKSSSRIRLTQIASIFLAIWMCSAGFVHICENNGDPFTDDPATSQELTYWRCIYWLLITMSTVGFGDISPNSDCGRFFIILFIMGTFAMFTSLIPELARHLGHSTKYHKPYKRVYGKRHIIVCGHITYESVSNFIRNFIHEDAAITNVNVVFVDNRKPELELEAFFKRHMNDVTFLQGSVMDVTTLKNVKLRYCDACLILANRYCDDPDEQDSANIMRATSVKNYYPRVRVIIQLLQHHNKGYLLHIPNWNWDKVNGDDVICISEMKLGLLAQNCLAPGVCTLMANLFTMRSFKIGNTRSWQDLYRYGAGNEIYAEEFAPAFVGMTFIQAAEICFTEFNVLLLGVAGGKNTRSKLRINPLKMTLGVQTTGFFIAQSPSQVKRVTKYKLGTKPVPPAYPCMVKQSISDTGQSLQDGTPMTCLASGEHQEDADHYAQYLEEVGYRLASHKPKKGEKKRLGSTDKFGRSMSDESSEGYDTTGTFHSRPARRLDDCVLDVDEVVRKDFKGHVVLCLLADHNSPLIGLINFIMPLRMANIRRANLKDVVIMSDLGFVMKEWSAINTFPGLYVFPGNPAHRSDLRALSLEKCSMCVVLSAKKHIVVDTTMLDKESILTALNVKGMFSDDVEKKIKSIGILDNYQNFQQHLESMKDIPLTVDLEFDENVAFLDQDDDDDPEVPLYMTQPYASGSTFAASSLDSLLSATYQSSQILTVVRALTTGGETAEIEQILSEALGIVRKMPESGARRDQSHLSLLSLDECPLASLKMDNLYRSLFVKALRQYGILVLGLYRLMDPHSIHSRAKKRYVITNPPIDFEVLPSDKVYCLQPYPPEEDMTSVKQANGSLQDSTNRQPPPYESTSDSSSRDDLEPIPAGTTGKVFVSRGRHTPSADENANLSVSKL